MPAPRDIPPYLLHKPSQCARVWIDGQEIPLGRHNSPESRERYDRLIAEWLANGRRLPADYLAPREYTVSELIVTYLEHAKREYSQGAKVKKEYLNLKPPLRHVRRLYGSIPVTQFGPKALKAVRHAMIDQHLGAEKGRIPKQLTRAYINEAMQRIRRMFRWGVEQEMIGPAIVQALESVPGLRRGKGGRETQKITPVPEAFVLAVKPYVSRQVWGLIELQLETGMRPCEAIALRGCDINMSGRVWEIAPTAHKTAHFDLDRLIQVGPRGQEVLRRFLRPDLQEYLFRPVDAEDERRRRMRAFRRTRVQPSQRDRRRPGAKRRPREHYTVDSYRKAIHRACDLADATARGTRLSLRICPEPQLLLFDEEALKPPSTERQIPRWSPNRLRHNFGTRIRRELGEVEGLAVAQILLGHTNQKTTEIYAEANRLRGAAAIELLG